METHVGC